VQPAVQDITVRQGDRFDLFVRLRQKVWNPALNGGLGDWEPGPYVDLTGKTVRSQIRTTSDAAAVAATFTPTISDQVALKGGCLLTLFPVDTRSLSVNGVYDVEVETTATPTDTETFLEGAVTVKKDTTRVP
jgi:hypothetical protein